MVAHGLDELTSGGLMASLGGRLILMMKASERRALIETSSANYEDDNSLC